ncbi:CpXC protein [Flexilinea flocculi]|uniref:CpXC protein n=2 Tax=Flexilinea flocculi TaxID=1678840 RepID=A0A0S7BP01_9CHLR|nr:CpXC protein [Flexilinea flocculi]
MTVIAEPSAGNLAEFGIILQINLMKGAFMAQTTTPCPRCHQQMIADVQQVFDLFQDPAAKERLLSGQVNVAVCPSCGYQSAVGVPVVYHDPEKELFLTYFPSELGLPINEQERILGPMITQVVNRLPPEKKKGYLLRPQSMLTYDTLIEKILEADGITKEMIKDQEKKIALLRRLLTSPEDRIAEIIKQEESLIDQSFFALFSNVQNSAVQSRDEKVLAVLKPIQDALLNQTVYGREVKARAESTQKAIQDIQDLGEQLNRDSLLNLVLNAPDDSYLQTLTGLARNGMDYEFFSKLSARIQAAEGEDNKKYSEIREKLLNLTKKIDQAVAEQMQLRKKVFDEIMKEDDIEQSLLKYARAIDDSFLVIVKTELQNARKNGDFMRSGKIQKILDTVEKMTKPSPEVELLEDLLSKTDEAEVEAAFHENQALVNDEFKAMLGSLIQELSKTQEADPEIIARIRFIQKLTE